MMKREKKSWGTAALFSLILILTALGLEFGFSDVDPLRLPQAPSLLFKARVFPSLADIDFSCAVSAPVISIDLRRKQASCAAVLSRDMAQCEDAAPMRGFGDKIRCGRMESSKCHEEGGIQSLGLFKGDTTCSTSNSETDLGPPAAHVRDDSGS